MNTIANLTMAMTTALGLSACTGTAVTGSYGYDPYAGGFAPYGYGYQPYAYAYPGAGGFAVFGDFGHHHDHFRREFRPPAGARSAGMSRNFSHQQPIAHSPPPPPRQGVFRLLQPHG